MSELYVVAVAGDPGRNGESGGGGKEGHGEGNYGRVTMGAGGYGVIIRRRKPRHTVGKKFNQTR